MLGICVNSKKFVDMRIISVQLAETEYVNHSAAPRHLVQLIKYKYLVWMIIRQNSTCKNLEDIILEDMSSTSWVTWYLILVSVTQTIYYYFYLTGNKIQMLITRENFLASLYDLLTAVTLISNHLLYYKLFATHFTAITAA